MKKSLLAFFLVTLINVCTAQDAAIKNNEPVISNGSMPSVVTDSKAVLHMVFISDDKLECISSSDKGISFSNPVIIDSIKDVFGIAGRGPQIVSTSGGLCVLAPDKNGNIHCYFTDANGKWEKAGMINDVAAVAKEGFVSVAARGDSIYAVWLDLRNNDKNKIAGALSVDAGRHWQKNKIIYQSPSGTVCECCKPSVLFKASGIYVMFRNFTEGNRDLYLTHSADGHDFNKPEKLGEGNWKLNACPMDGGGIACSGNDNLQTVWRRVDTVYSCAPGRKEQAIGKGRNCTIAAAGNKYVYAWIENKSIVCLLPDGRKINAGEGNFPLLNAMNEKEFLCTWQSGNNIYSRLIGF